jgi:MFS transporter, PPP family, 3-phenylpropionic acid transporter
VARSRLKVLFTLQGIALGVILPFFVPLLAERGLGPAGIGIVLGIAALAALLSYPVWGILADGPLGRLRTIAVAALTAVAGGVWLLLSGDDPAVLAVGVSLALVGSSAWGPVSDAVALAALADEPTAYGRLRAWTSLGWAAAAPVAGLVWAWAGPAIVLVGFAACALGVGGLVWSSRPSSRAGRAVPAATVGIGLPEAERMGRTGTGLPRADDGPYDDEPYAAPPPPPPPEASEAYAPPPGPGGLHGWRPLLVSPVLIGFLVGLLVSGIGAHAAWSFVGLRILEQGGGTFLVGIAAAIPALVEVPVFRGSRSLADRFGLRALFVAGAFIAAAILVLMAVSPEAWMVAGLRSVDGVAYALRYMAVVLIIGALLPGRLHAVGQSMGWLMTAGIAPVIGDTGGGLIYDLMGGPVLFLVCAGFHVAGALIVYLVLRGRSFAARRETASAVA